MFVQFIAEFQNYVCLKYQFKYKCNILLFLFTYPQKLPDPPIINTAQHTYFRIDFQCPYTNDRFCSRYMHGLAYEIYNLWIIITD